MNKKVREWLEAVIEAAVVILLLFVFCWPVSVQGVSMESTLNHGDRIFISRFMAWIDNIDAGDIVIAQAVLDGEKQLIVKRLIAREGDRVTIKDGDVFVNEERIAEDYIQTSTRGDFDAIVPEDSYFLLGDNRQQSVDSRQIGFITKDELKGKVIMRWFPFNEIKFF